MIDKPDGYTSMAQRFRPDCIQTSRIHSPFSDSGRDCSSQLQFSNSRNKKNKLKLLWKSKNRKLKKQSSLFAKLPSKNSVNKTKSHTKFALTKIYGTRKKSKSKFGRFRESSLASRSRKSVDKKIHRDPYSSTRMRITSTLHETLGSIEGMKYIKTTREKLISTDERKSNRIKITKQKLKKVNQMNLK